MVECVPDMSWSDLERFAFSRTMCMEVKDINKATTRPLMRKLICNYIINGLYIEIYYSFKITLKKFYGLIS